MRRIAASECQHETVNLYHSELLGHFLGPFLAGAQPEAAAAWLGQIQRESNRFQWESTKIHARGSQILWECTAGGPFLHPFLHLPVSGWVSDAVFGASQERGELRVSQNCGCYGKRGARWSNRLKNFDESRSERIALEHLSAKPVGTFSGTGNFWAIFWTPRRLLPRSPDDGKPLEIKEIQ